MIKATIIADSVSAHTGQRITTFELEYHRFIHSELMTHRQFSRNAASSRAIPIDKMIEQVNDDPAVPLYWGLNQSGMQAKDEEADEALSIATWLDARNKAVESARALQELGLHKQIVNRVLEPFQMMKTLVTATSFDNFFNLRCHKDAQPEIKHLADLMYQAMQESTPEVLRAYEWHTPYIKHKRTSDGELHYIADNMLIPVNAAIQISCSCAAQVSYRKNDTSIEKALAIYDKLVNSEPVHASAFEHCATPIDPSGENDEFEGITHWHSYRNKYTFYSGNFTNWVQYRQLIPNHDCKRYEPKRLNTTRMATISIPHDNC
ncbi:FAD-dependent thymidylate synthase [Moraxella bovoculi]|uniref:FAD-dependent thymidylate synthase n=1 Tax=Moraxella bovoculi TaxID=386891 RepID=UPI0009B9BA9C|nr:FAD-dependent thymidylate synthase [Moraxella bovoculi]